MEDLGGYMISVIMLTYNRENLVSRAIESVLNQSWQNFEFIIVDNGSTDRSGQIVDSYASQDDRIRVIHRERGSIGAGRNTGLDAATGDYIAFIDDDDWVEPDFLAFLYGLAIESHADVAICGATDRVFNEKRVMTTEEALIELMWRKKYTAGFPIKLFRSQMFEGLHFAESCHYDDIGLIYQIFARAQMVAYHGLPKYHVFRHSQNNSAWTTNHKLLTSETLNEYLHAYRVRTKWLSECFPGSAAAWRYFEWSFMISMVEKIERLGLHSCAEQLADMKQELREHKNDFMVAPELLPFERNWIAQYIDGEKRETK